MQSFTFGDTNFKNPIGTFPDSTSVSSVSFVQDRVGSLGGGVLSRFSIFFDYPGSCIYAKPGAKISMPFNFNMSGLEVQHDGWNGSLKPIKNAVVQQRFIPLGKTIWAMYRTT